MKLSPNEQSVLTALDNRHIVQCVANCKRFGDFFPNALNGTRITRGLIGGLEAKGLLSVEQCVVSSLRHCSYKLSELGKQVLMGLSANG